MLTAIKPLMTVFKPYAASLARHVLTAGGVLLVSKGYVDAAAADALVGAGITVFGIIWAMLEKKLR